jgi:GNAT superfamily N-acetyltransferase
MGPEVDILTLDESNLERIGFFCYKSKRKTDGYRKKLSWLRHRLAEGLRLHILFEDGISKGFIEYIPGEYAWRAVRAPSYLFVHCMWVVGQAKGKGYGSRLLDCCVQAAEAGGFDGVAALASRETWLAGPPIFEKFGFQVVDQAPPSFALYLLPLRKGSAPTLPKDWDSRASALGAGLTVVTTDQCPYVDRMKQAVHKAGEALGIPSREVHFSTAQQVQEYSPSAYGVYSIVHDGEVVASHPIGTDALLERLKRSL